MIRDWIVRFVVFGNPFLFPSTGHAERVRKRRS